MRPTPRVDSKRLPSSGGGRINGEGGIGVKPGISNICLSYARKLKTLEYQCMMVFWNFSWNCEMKVRRSSASVRHRLPTAKGSIGVHSLERQTIQFLEPEGQRICKAAAGMFVSDWDRLGRLNNQRDVLCDSSKQECL